MDVFTSFCLYVRVFLIYFYISASVFVFLVDSIGRLDEDEAYSHSVRYMFNEQPLLATLCHERRLIGIPYSKTRKHLKLNEVQESCLVEWIEENIKQADQVNNELSEAQSYPINPVLMTVPETDRGSENEPNPWDERDENENKPWGERDENENEKDPNEERKEEEPIEEIKENEAEPDVIDENQPREEDKDQKDEEIENHDEGHVTQSENESFQENALDVEEPETGGDDEEGKADDDDDKPDDDNNEAAASPPASPISSDDIWATNSPLPIKPVFYYISLLLLLLLFYNYY